MSTDQQQNGTRTDAARVRFGDGPDQEIPASWAAYMLRKLATEGTERQRNQFAKLLGEAAISAVKPR